MSTADLFETVAKGRRAEVAALIDQGVDVNATDPAGKTALIWAAHEGQAEMVRLLMAAGADVHQAERQFGVTALMLAAHRGHVTVVEALLQAEALDCDKALFLAAKQGHVAIVQMLKGYLTRQLSPVG